MEDNSRERIEAFWDIMRTYAPDWGAIANTNQFPERYSDEDARIEKVKCFCKAMKAIRIDRNCSLEQVGEMLSCSKQYVSKIEHGGIKKYQSKGLTQ